MTFGSDTTPGGELDDRHDPNPSQFAGRLTD
jgi:hypothetical protein